MAESTHESQEEEQEPIRTTSLSQSCVYIPKETSVVSGYSRDSATFEPLAGERKEDTQRRYLAYKNTWTHIEQCIDVLLSQRHDALLGQVVEFVETTKKQWISVAKGDVPSSDAAIVPACLGMIPTASIIAGTNMSDHGVLYQHLTTRLESEVTPHVITLRSHSCDSGMSAVVKEIHAQLIEGWIPDETPQQGSNSQKRRIPRLTISILLSWHFKKMEIERSADVDSKASTPDNSCAGKTTELEATHHRPVVFVLEDFDMFSPQVLEDLITSLK